MPTGVAYIAVRCGWSDRAKEYREYCRIVWNGFRVIGDAESARGLSNGAGVTA